MIRVEVKVKRCDQCAAVRVNGVFCHEMGCPNDNKVWLNGEWVRVRTCEECGCELLDGQECCS